MTSPEYEIWCTEVVLHLAKQAQLAELYGAREALGEKIYRAECDAQQAGSRVADAHRAMVSALKEPK